MNCDQKLKRYVYWSVLKQCTYWRTRNVWGSCSFLDVQIVSNESITLYCTRLYLLMQWSQMQTRTSLQSHALHHSDAFFLQSFSSVVCNNMGFCHWLLFSQPIPEELQNGEGFGYVVAFRPFGTTTWIQTVVTSPDTPRYVFRNESILPFSPYEVKVGVYNNKGEGPFSSITTVFSAEEGMWFSAYV